MLSFMSYCQEWLSKTPEAISYLKNNRKLTDASIKEFQIGYLPKYANITPETITQHPELVRLRGRIVVPIFSEFNKIVGFAGRVPDPLVKGWWNTSFTKSSHLYGFNSSRKSVYENNKCYVFEGYFDKMMMSQYGLGNSVAAMGTNLGVRRIGLIARYCDRICVCFDTDQNDAGLLGMFRTLADMYAIGIGRQPSSWKLTMIQLPLGVDPDDFICNNGLDAFLSLEKPIGEELLKNAEKAYTQLKWRMQERKKKENI